MFAWYNYPLDSRAHPGGEYGVNGRLYKGGEYLPFYIPRPEMPQIDEADLHGFFDFAFAHGIKIIQKTFKPWDLHAHQRVDINKLITMPDSLLTKPVIVSKDGYVLDGNHRWHRHAELGTDVPALVVNLNFEAAIRLMFAYPKTYAYGDGNHHPIRN